MDAPRHIINYRKELCRTCKTPCEHQNSSEFRTPEEAACPIVRWKAYTTLPRATQNIRGAGDLVAVVAQPIAGVIDKVFKTKVKTCGACAKRREMLNKALPIGKNN